MTHDAVLSMIRENFPNRLIVTSMEDNDYVYLNISFTNDFEIGDICEQIKVLKKDGTYEQLSWDYEISEEAMNSIKYIDVDENLMRRS